jgi:hypothetical protein
VFASSKALERPVDASFEPLNPFFALSPGESANGIGKEICSGAFLLEL